VLEFGIDATKMTSGQAAAMASLKQTVEAARVAGNQVESQQKKIFEFFSDMKRLAIEATGIFIGGMGTKEFITNITNLDAATARFAKTMDMITEDLSAWENIWTQFGGSKEGAVQTMQTLSTEMQKFVAGIPSENFLALTTRLNVNPRNAAGGMKDPGQFFLEIVDAINQLRPEQARLFMGLLGLDQSAVNVAQAGRSDLEKRVKDIKSITGPLGRAAQLADEYQKATGRLDTASTALGRNLGVILEPALTATANWFTALIERSPAAAAGVAAVSAVLTALWGLPLLRWLVGGAAGRAALTATANWFTALIERSPAAAAGVAAGRAVIRGLGTVAGSRAMGLLGPIGALLGMTGPAGESDEAEHARRGPVGGSGADAATREAFIRKTAVETGPAGESDEAERARRGPVGGSGADAATREAFIRKTAVELGVNPDQMMQFARREGFPGKIGDDNSSFGDFQLHYGGLSARYPHPGLGDKFTAATGKNARDQSTWQEQDRFALEWLRDHGPGSWMGWPGGPVLPYGAGAAAQHSSYNTNSSSNRTTTIEVGEINIHTPATDAKGIAGDINEALKRQASLGSWNQGLV
jgi:hypothetical protein